MIPLGLSQAVSVRIGQARGACEKDDTCRSCSDLGNDGADHGGFCGRVHERADSRSPPRLWRIGDCRAGCAILLIAGFFQIFDGIQITSSGALRGFEDTRAPMFIGMFSYWLVALPIILPLRFQARFRPAGIWFGFVTGLALAAAALVSRLLLRIRRA